MCVHRGQKAHFDALSDNVAPFKDASLHVEIFHGSAAEHLGTVWAHVNGNPVLTFIDVTELKPSVKHGEGIELSDAFFGGDWWRRKFLDARDHTGDANRAAMEVVEESREIVRAETGASSATPGEWFGQPAQASL